MDRELVKTLLGSVTPEMFDTLIGEVGGEAEEAARIMHLLIQAKKFDAVVAAAVAGMKFSENSNPSEPLTRERIARVAMVGGVHIGFILAVYALEQCFAETLAALKGGEEAN